MDIRRVVGENVRRHREAAGLSQEELAARMGVDQGYVSSLEAGRRNPTILTMWHVAVALEVQPASLFEPVQVSLKRKPHRAAPTKSRRVKR
jgi:transcriptional regulator with XRE-family HTH domain